MKKDNLRALAKFLREVAQPKAFDMRNFCAVAPDIFSSFQPDQVHEKHTGCGTVACAIGHAPFLFPAKRGEDWPEYSERVFGLTQYSKEWEWVFGADWKNVDNTPGGAADRIDWLIDKGLPEDAGRQMEGLAELCYSQ